MLDDVSVYRNALPIGGMLVDPLLPVGLFVCVNLRKFCILPVLFLSLHLITQFCRRYPPVFGYLIFVVSVFCILSYLVRLYISFPTETLRYFCSVWLNLTIVFLSNASSIYFLFDTSLSEVEFLLTVIESMFVNFLSLKLLSWLFFT